MKSLILLSLFAALAQGQVQHGRIATDFYGQVVLFESDSAIAGETAPPSKRLLETFTGGRVSITAASPLEPLAGGAAWPHTNDNGDIRAYSLYEMSITGHGSSPVYTGVVRHVTDGWEVRRAGRAGLNRGGRWAVFSGGLQTLWVDLWTGAEFPLPGTALSVDSVTDDGAVAATAGRSLAVYRPAAAPQVYPLPFTAASPLLDRYARYAAVQSADGLWRVNLATAEVEPWVQPCSDCQPLDIAAGGAAVLYTQKSAVYVAKEPGFPPQRLTPDGQIADSAAFNGAADKVLTPTADGIVAFDLGHETEELILAGPTSFDRQPVVLAPGLWVRQQGKGLANAVIRLNGATVEPLRRSSTDIVWVVPAEFPPDPVTLEIGQPKSTFAPVAQTLTVQSAAPTFVHYGDRASSTTYYYQRPIVTHEATGSPMTASDPLRPGETFAILMTGLNGQAAAVEWIIYWWYGAEFPRPTLVSAEPSPENPHWTVVRLKMPEILPTGTYDLSAIYGDSRDNVKIITDEQPNQP